jgi:hypothetical protein
MLTSIMYAYQQNVTVEDLAADQFLENGWCSSRSVEIKIMTNFTQFGVVLFFFTISTGSFYTGSIRWDPLSTCKAGGGA